MQTNKGFQLVSDNDDFNQRSSDVFTSLQNLEDNHHRESSREDANDVSVMKPDPEFVMLDHCKGRKRLRDECEETCFSKAVARVDSSNFKKPFSKPPKVIPDYLKHPDKWTAYTLGDVHDRDISESSNTSVALAFISERRKLVNPDTHTKCELIGGHQFKTPAKQMDINSTIKQGESKFIMDECVVGQKPQTKQKLREHLTPTRTASDVIKLTFEEPVDDVLEKDSVLPLAEVASAEAIKFKPAKKKDRQIRTRDSDD